MDDRSSIVQVYVAGASMAVSRVRAFMDRVDAHDTTAVIGDWTPAVREHQDRGIADSSLTSDVRALHAARDLEAVAAADVFVLLAEARLPTRGAWVELGFAIAIRAERMRRGEPPRPYIVVAGGERKSIFTADHWPVSEYAGDRFPLTDVEIARPEPECDAAAFEYVRDRARIVLADRAR